jgi:hypothetical protein
MTHRAGLDQRDDVIVEHAQTLAGGVGEGELGGRWPVGHLGDVHR